MIRKPLALLALCLSLCGCCYRVPLTKRLPMHKHMQGVAAEKEARRNGWDGAWDARIHSLHTCPVRMTARAGALTVLPLQLVSWPLQWAGVVKPHGEYVRKFWRESVDEEYRGGGDDPVPPDDELWMNRGIVWIWGE